MKFVGRKIKEFKPLAFIIFQPNFVYLCCTETLFLVPIFSAGFKAYPVPPKFVEAEGF